MKAKELIDVLLRLEDGGLIDANTDILMALDNEDNSFAHLHQLGLEKLDGTDVTEAEDGADVLLLLPAHQRLEREFKDEDDDDDD